MGTLIVYGLLIAGLIAGALAVRSSIENAGAQKERAKLQPVIAACKADVKTATDANASLRADVAKLAADRQAQTEGIIALERQAAEAVKRGAQERARTAPALAELQAHRAAAQERATAPPAAGATCEQRLDGLAARLVEIALREARDRPAIPEPGVKGDALRIGK